MSYMVSVEESIKDILITSLGSRVMRPEYGS
ncbi:baseplate assembly protein, partial [Campylobacter coli]|nr:baseplate assembly protein [Campylobacter coli]EBD1800107.1 baseplate assembly protein [Campylobacter coli]